MAGLTILRGRVTRLEGGLPHVEVADLGSGVVHGPLEVATPSVIVVGARVLVAAIGDAVEDLVVVGVIGATASGGSGGDPVPVSSPTAPDAPADSMLWADETTGRLRRWIAGVWRGVSEDGHTHSANDVNDGVLALARLPVAPSGNSNATQIVRADDARLSDPRTPTGHAHAAGDVTSGTFALARIPTASAGEVSAVKVPLANDPRLSDARTPIAHTHAGYAEAYSTWFANIVAGAWNTVTHNLGTEYVNPQFLVGTPAVPYELEWENVAADGDNTIRFRADAALADVGVLIVGW